MNSNVARFSSRETIAKDAAEWLVLLDREQPPSDEELSRLRSWMNESPAHREELLSLARMWEMMNVLTELAVPLGVAERSQMRRKQQIFGGLRWATAAVALISAALFFVIGADPEPDADNGLYATAIGQQQSITLSDGSSIVLNTDTQLSVEYADDYRSIYLLRGEALFEVSEDKDRPFRVYAGDGRIEAVGTAFSVYVRDNTVDVTVTEGKVAVASISHGQAKPGSGANSESSISAAISEADNDASARTLGYLEGGQVTTITSGIDEVANLGSTMGEIVTIDEQELRKRISWRDGILTFSGDSLETVIEEVSRYTTLTIEIADPEIKAIKIGGRFPIGHTEEMFDALEANFGLSVTQFGSNRVVVAGASSP